MSGHDSVVTVFHHPSGGSDDVCVGRRWWFVECHSQRQAQEEEVKHCANKK